MAAYILIVWNTAFAVPCSRLKAEPEEWVAAKVDALVLAARAAYESKRAVSAYERVLDGINTSIRQCKLAEIPDFVTRHQVFLDYIEAASLDRKTDHELGLVVPDKQYFVETRKYVQIPEFLTDQTFLGALSRYETLERAKSFLRKLNSNRAPSDQLVFFSYKSRHLGTPDNDSSHRRLLIVVPGNTEQGVPEKWVQFGVPDPGARTQVRNISVVAAIAGPGGTFDAYFKDFYRTYRKGQPITINGRWELGEGDDNCVKCHKSGILPIFPVKGSVSMNEQQFVSDVNQRFLSYGAPRFGKYLDERKFGPGLSSATPVERRQRFGPNFGETVQGRAMTCASCHQREGLGALNWPMNRVIISSFVKGGAMPLGHKLKVAERRELYTKLVEEYFATDQDKPGILKAWLLSTR
jgi:hypothetical protein